MVELLENIHLYNFMSTTNNENLYAVYSLDGGLAEFQENNLNKFSKVAVGQTIAGGESNRITGNFSTILGGYNNQIKSSDFATILAGRNNIINNQLGATIIADGENRNHYADSNNALTIDFRNGIYLKNSNSNLSGPADTSTQGVIGKIQNDPFPNQNRVTGLRIGSYIAGSQYENVVSAKNYYPATQTTLTLEANNWFKTPGYPLERTDSISSIQLGPNGVKLIGTKANQQVAGNPAVAYIDINSDITIESAKDGNSITLIADDTMDLNSSTTNLNSYDINLNANGDTILNNPYGGIKLSASNINLQINNIPTSSSSAGISGQISFDDNYFYRHNGKNWTRTAMSTW